VGAISAAAGTFGLILGGLLASAVGWRWIFSINVPAGALVIAFTLRGGALGFAVISAIVASRTGALLARGVTGPAAMTSGFHTGLVVSAGLVAASALAALVLLREDGRGQHVNLIELQTAGVG
jgi:MFS family permease